jgi:hypothetical protein
VTVLGAKAKFLMVMASVAVDPDDADPDAVVGAEGALVVEVAPPELEQAARRRAAPNRMTVIRPRALRGPGAAASGVVGVWCWAGWVITLRSVPPRMWMRPRRPQLELVRPSSLLTGLERPGGIFFICHCGLLRIQFRDG